MLDWTYSGVNHSLPGNGGEECVAFIPPMQKILETTLYTCLGLIEAYIAYPHLKLPDDKTIASGNEPLGKRVLLFLMTLTFGIELGFKLATGQLIWILNPCHIVSMMQIFLLVAPPSKTTLVIFRVHVHCLSGAVIAILFPVINTRLLPFETEVYFIQHFLMLVIPYYLMRQGGAYTPEALGNFWWVLMTLGVLFVWHWTGLQALAIVSQVNLNNMMCPAVSDPFYGRWYRTCAATHQHVVIMLHGKVYTWIASHFLPRWLGQQRSSDAATDQSAPQRSAVGGAVLAGSNGSAAQSNGHAKGQ